MIVRITPNCTPDRAVETVPLQNNRMPRRSTARARLKSALPCQQPRRTLRLTQVDGHTQDRVLSLLARGAEKPLCSLPCSGGYFASRSPHKVGTAGRFGAGRVPGTSQGDIHPHVATHDPGRRKAQNSTSRKRRAWAFYSCISFFSYFITIVVIAV